MKGEIMNQVIIEFMPFILFFVVLPVLLLLFHVACILVDLGAKIERCGGWPTYELVKEKFIKPEYREDWSKWEYIHFILDPCVLFDF